MKRIRRLPVDMVVFPILYKVLYVPGGKKDVVYQQYHLSAQAIQKSL